MTASGTVVAVTHDRYFLDNVAGWILELDRGAGIPWEGNYSSWLEQKQARLAAEEKADKARQSALERELEWIRMSPKARQSKGKARLNAFIAVSQPDLLSLYGSLQQQHQEKRLFIQALAAAGMPASPRASATECSSTDSPSCCHPVGSWA